MRKKEVAAVVVIVAAALVCCIAFGMRIATKPQREQEFYESVNRTYVVGDALVLNAEKDAADTFDGQTYDAGLNWMGTLELTVESATLGPLPSNEKYVRHKNDDAETYLTCVVRVRNIDAKATDQSDGREYWFYISSLVEPNSDLVDIAYFDGTPPNAAPKDGNCFELPPGNEATYTVSFPLMRIWLQDENDIDLRVGSRQTDKYRIDLGLSSDDFPDGSLKADASANAMEEGSSS